jgi:hypothetical protein
LQDYSAQWADYYRSLGMMKEAEMIESQARGSAAPPQPQAAPQPAMAGQPDYSAQWAEYYRSLGTVYYFPPIFMTINETVVVITWILMPDSYSR